MKDAGRFAHACFEYTFDRLECAICHVVSDESVNCVIRFWEGPKVTVCDECVGKDIHEDCDMIGDQIDLVVAGRLVNASLVWRGIRDYTRDIRY